MMHWKAIIALTGCLATIFPQVSVGASVPGPAIGIPPSRMEQTLTAMPLLIAHQNLMLARSKVLEQKYPEAAAALSMVARSLAYFEMLGRGPNGQSAEFMRQRIEEYTAVMASDHSDAVSRIDDWMCRIRKWDGGK
jgi:hypothetical protein